MALKKDEGFTIQLKIQYCPDPIGDKENEKPKGPGENKQVGSTWMWCIDTVTSHDTKEEIKLSSLIINEFAINQGKAFEQMMRSINQNLPLWMQENKLVRQ